MVDVYVLGDGLPELAAALELAEVGLSVRVGLPARPSEEWSGPQDRGVADPDGAVAGLLEHIASPLAADAPVVESAQPVSTPSSPVLLRTAAGKWAPQPTPAVVGIPAVPLSTRALALLGGGGATRAYLDRVKPVLTIGKTHALGDLVRARLGRVALERLVEPFARERFGLPADEVEVAIAAPGLNEALTRAGSLSGAVLALTDRDVARETLVAPRGGWAALRDALLDRLALYGVEFGDASIAVVRPDAGDGAQSATASDAGGAGIAGGDADIVPGDGPADISGSDDGSGDEVEASWIVTERDVEFRVRALVFDLAGVGAGDSGSAAADSGTAADPGTAADSGTAAESAGTGAAVTDPRATGAAATGPTATGAAAVDATAAGNAAPAPLPLAEAEELRPARRRVEVEARIEDPGLPTADGELPALQLVMVDGETWSVRLEREGGAFLARVRGPAGPAGPAETSSVAEAVPAVPAAAPVTAPAPVLAASTALAAASARARGVLAAAGIEPAGPLEARAVVAPYASTELRDADLERLREFRAEHHELLPVGRELHGGDLARAVSDARAAAVVLRRRLTGISD